MSKRTTEIRPRTTRNAIKMGLLCAIFVWFGIMGLFEGQNPRGMFVGVIAILFFGGGGSYSILRMLRRRVPIILTSEYLEQRYPEGSAYIQWRDVEKIDIASLYHIKMVGIRLKTYNSYFSQMSPTLAIYMMKMLPHLKLTTRVVSLVGVSSVAKVLPRLKGHDLKQGLQSFGEVRNLEEALLWSRKRYGYDILLSWTERDRSAGEFVKLLGEYHAAAELSE